MIRVRHRVSPGGSLERLHVHEVAWPGVLLALADVTACGNSKPSETPAKVAALLRDKWGSTKGFRSFDYSCTRLDAQGRLFTCLTKDRTDTVRIASFDVVCNSTNCTWTDYPAYVG